MEQILYKTEQIVEGYKEYNVPHLNEKGELLFTEHIKEPIIVEKKTPIVMPVVDELDKLRLKREEECFLIVNRGILWYNKLTSQQLLELTKWYQEWLDVTATKIEPVKPEWLK